MRYALTIAYNGTHFLGLQAQKETKNTIIGTLHNVLTSLGIDSKIVASGRTDKGVHATGQVCHVDLPPFWEDTKKLKRVLNRMLPPSIFVKSVKPVHKNFHARYSAKKRVYRYIIKEQKTTPFENDFVTFVDSIDFLKLQKNIKLFEGKHDFKYFMKTGSNTKSNIRIIYKAFAYRYKKYIILYFEANGFLRSQIRMMVSSLIKLDKEQLEEKLKCKNNYNVKPAPSNGLYLARIKY